VHHGVQMVSQTQASLLRIVQKASDLSGMIGGIAQGPRVRPTPSPRSIP
jgi:methyl-accepting chemotaxis protein